MASYESKSDTRTLTAGAGAVAVLVLDQGPWTINGALDYGLPSMSSFYVSNTSALLGATVTLQLQVRFSGDPGWTTLKTSTLTLATLGLIGGDKHAAICKAATEGQQAGKSSIDLRVIASCTGANVTIESEWVVLEPSSPR